jgi:hypothetical protein
MRGLWAQGMIGKDYFKRQASTLRKMVGVAQDQTVAARLTFLADDFEAKADDGSKQPEQRPRAGPEDGKPGRQ